MLVSDIKNEVLNAIDRLCASSESPATRLYALEDIKEHLDEKIEEMEDATDE